MMMYYILCNTSLPQKNAVVQQFLIIHEIDAFVLRVLIFCLLSRLSSDTLMQNEAGCTND